MKTYKYKTLRGFFRAVAGQVTIEQFFRGRVYLCGRGWCNVEVPEDCTKDFATQFAKWLYSTAGDRRKEVTEGLVNGRGDLSLFQCFFVDFNVHPEKIVK